jgi:ATP-dependent Lon protease
VLKDSANTAYNIVRTKGRDFGVPEAILKEKRIVVHLVRIAELRDGPSAGLAFVVGMVSALTGRAVKAGTAMTGEVSLHGEVTGVGGMVEKASAAARAGRKLILIPAENANEVARLDSAVLDRARIVPVATVEAALREVLASVGAPAANTSLAGAAEA